MNTLPYKLRRFAKRYADKFKRYLQTYKDPTITIPDHVVKFTRLVHPGMEIEFEVERMVTHHDPKFEAFAKLLMSASHG